MQPNQTTECEMKEVKAFHRKPPWRAGLVPCMVSRVAITKAFGKFRNLTVTWTGNYQDESVPKAVGLGIYFQRRGSPETPSRLRS